VSAYGGCLKNLKDLKDQEKFSLYIGGNLYTSTFLSDLTLTYNTFHLGVWGIRGSSSYELNHLIP
jgi:hypothetical protein